MTTVIQYLETSTLYHFVIPELLGFDHEHPNVLHPESCSESTSYSDKHTDICPNDAHTDAKAKQLTRYVVQNDNDPN